MIYDNKNSTYHNLLMHDTKIGIIESFKALDINVSKSLRKDVLAEMLATIFEENPFYIINRLSNDDQYLLTQLVACKQDEFVTIPKRSEPLGLQVHHLVVTVPDGDKWRLYMPDSIRQHIDRCAMSNLSAYPGMQEWNDAMAELNKLQKQVDEDVRFNPTILPIQQLPLYLQRLRDEVKELDKLQKKLQRLEPQIKQYNIDFTNVYSSIRGSKSQCETKLALMGMFRWG